MFKEIRSTSQNEWGYVIICICMIDYITRDWEKNSTRRKFPKLSRFICMPASYICSNVFWVWYEEIKGIFVNTEMAISLERVQIAETTVSIQQFIPGNKIDDLSEILAIF